MPRPAISVENLSKAYRIGLKEEIPDTLAGAVTGFLKSPFRNLRQLSRLDTFRHQGEDEDIFWALKDVSFEVQEGEVLGVIGRNGAGKSTLLKILSRITEPTSGRAVIRGRVSSLLEVGTGFHPELSGRENVYLNGTILGMTKAEIDRKFDEIVDFSGVEKFLDTPIKRYSSGMKVRLAFAVAAHLEPEILIIDEVLAVGDAEFQKKCLGKMQHVASHGRTVLFVSHNMAAVEGLCTKGLVLSNGTSAHFGNISDCIGNYLTHPHATAATHGTVIDLSQHVNHYGDGRPLITWAQLYTDHINESTAPQMARPLTIRIGLSGYSALPHAQVGVLIRNSFGQLVSLINTGMCPPREQLAAEHQTAELTIPRLPLVPGRYTIDISVAIRYAGRIDFAENAITFEVESHDVYGSGYSLSTADGICYLDAHWHISEDTTRKNKHSPTA